MGSIRIDRTGQKFNRLTITKELGSGRVEATCECGVVGEYPKSQVTTGHTKSCGCYHRDRMGEIFTTHGLRGKPIYLVWRGILNRCYLPTTAKYPRYGGRGITVCEEWRSDVTKFNEWAIAHGWVKGLQVDRINNDGNYEPSNCQIVTNMENCSPVKKGTGKNNTSGCKGVRKRSSGTSWQAQIDAGGKMKSKTFKTFEEAVMQRKKWEQEILDGKS